MALMQVVWRVISSLGAPQVHRVLLALVGGFAVTLYVTSALAQILVSEGVDNPGDAFFWSAFVALFVYFGAMVWAFAAASIQKVTLTFAGVILACALIVWAHDGDASLGYGIALGRLAFLVLLCVALWVGFAALALSQNKHWAAVTSEHTCPDITARALRTFGWIALATSVVPSVLRDGYAFGLLLWPMMAFGVGLAVSFTIAYRPRLLRGMARDAARLTRTNRESASL